MRHPIDHAARLELTARHRTLRERIIALGEAAAECRADAALHDLPPSLAALVARLLVASDAVCDVAEGQ